MKTVFNSSVLFLALILCSNIDLWASDEKYVAAMTKNIQAVYKATSVKELQEVVHAFSRIASTEKTKWEPYYYAAFGNIQMANFEQNSGTKDNCLDEALALINKAKEILPNSSEILSLEGFVHMIRIGIDPQSRGQEYSGLAMQSLGKAIELDPNNPRALALMAQMQYGSAKFFGSSTSEACATNAAALQKFSTFKSDNPVAPTWGKQMSEKLATECK